MDKKRIALIGAFILVVIAIGFALYKVFFEGEKVPEGYVVLPSGEVVPETEYPPSGTGEFIPGEVGPGVLPPSEVVTTKGYKPAEKIIQRETLVLDTRVTNPVVDKNGTTQFLNKDDGKFYRLRDDGTTQVLSDKVFYNVENVVWSPNNNESIIEYPDGSNIYYNFLTKEQVTLPKHWEDFSFSTDGAQIATKSISMSPENRWLISSDPDGTNVKFIESLGENADKVIVDWSPTRKVVALSRTGTPLGADRQEVLLIGQNSENFKSIIVEGRDFRSQWSPTGKQLLYSIYSARSDYKPELWVVNADGNEIDTNRRPLDLNTWADKCAFADERFVYCGVPQAMETGAGLEPSITDLTPDDIFRIDLRSGSKTTVRTDESHIIEQIFISNDGDKLHFTDKLQDGLFTIDI
jgi:hypothetical protein